MNKRLCVSLYAGHLQSIQSTGVTSGVTTVASGCGLPAGIGWRPALKHVLEFGSLQAPNWDAVLLYH